MKKTTTQKATDIINQLKESFINDSGLFDFHCSQYISGATNREIRQEIVRQLTGEVKPLTQCGMYAAADIMKASFQQYSLFI